MLLMITVKNNFKLPSSVTTQQASQPNEFYYLKQPLHRQALQLSSNLDNNYLLERVGQEAA
jgi:hypothetical protein